MDIFIKACAGILISVVLILVLSKQSKDMTVLLVISACCMVISAAFSYLESVLSFFYKLEELGNLNSSLLKTLLKATGIGMLTEIIQLICSDSGNAALGKSLQILGTAVIIWLSIPLFSELLDLAGNILGAL